MIPLYVLLIAIPISVIAGFMLCAILSTDDKLCDIIEEENYRHTCDAWLNVEDKVIEETIKKTKMATTRKMQDLILKESTIIDGMDHCYCLTYEQICLIAKRASDEDHEKANK